MDYHHKYLKYKKKYLNLKNIQLGGYFRRSINISTRNLQNDGRVFSITHVGRRDGNDMYSLYMQTYYREDWNPTSHNWASTRNAADMSFRRSAPSTERRYTLPDLERNLQSAIGSNEIIDCTLNTFDSETNSRTSVPIGHSIHDIIRMAREELANIPH
jgi:hypothetical protein